MRAAFEMAGLSVNREHATEETMQPVVGVLHAANATRGLLFCSIECARHHGVEPYRMALPDEYDEVCAGCGFDPADMVDYLMDQEKEEGQ